MAGTYTHLQFMRDLQKKIKFGENSELLVLSGQGHDLLFFIKLRDLKNFANRKKMMEKVAANRFKDTVIAWQKEYLKSANEELKIMLYGYIAHHVLDSYIHPWIKSKCEGKLVIERNNKWDKDERHVILESALDMLVMDPYKYKINKFKLKDETKKSINEIFNQVYGISNIGYYMSQGLSNMRGFIWLYRLDRLGIKKVFYQIIDKFRKDKQKYRFLAFNYSKKDLRLLDATYFLEFQKLYKGALSRASLIILEIEESLAHKKIAEIQFDKSAI